MIPWVIAVLILGIDGLVIFGGVKKIADVTTYLTPIMALIYLGFGLVILILILFGGIVVKDTKDFFADYDHALSKGKAE